MFGIICLVYHKELASDSLKRTQCAIRIMNSYGKSERKVWGLCHKMMSKKYERENLSAK